MTERALFAVAGRPVLHSLSPILFRAAFPRDGRAALYTRVSASTAAEALRFARELGLAGLNVTAPLKEEAFGLVEVGDEASAVLGAVNTLVREGAGFRGFNTDPEGAAGALADAGVDVRGRRALVLGAGGAGRAAAWALRRLGAEVVLCNRTDDRAFGAAPRLGVAAAKWADLPRVLAASDVLVSALPPDAVAVRPEWLRPGLVVLEAAYPAPPLTRAARARGCVVLPGESWLVRQAVPAFRLFTGAEPDAASMVKALAAPSRRRSRDALKIALVGFMGSGKTTVGRRLAEGLGLAFEDSDERVERRLGRSIPEIFRAEGEPAFRREESRALREILAGRPGVVCACGGGSMESAENRATVAAEAIVVWLHAPAGVCLSRIDPATRPLVGQSPRSQAGPEALFLARIPCYAEAADIAVGSEGSEERTAGTIHEEIRRLVAD